MRTSGCAVRTVHISPAGGVWRDRCPKELVAWEDSVGLGDQLDMVLDHFKTDHGIGRRIYDGPPHA